MTDLDYSTVMKLVKGVSRSVSSNFPPYITAEDTEGALWVWIYENRLTVKKLVGEDPGMSAKVAPLVRRAAFDYCNKERSQVEGYAPEDTFKYTLPKVSRLLEDVFEYVDWQSFGKSGDGQPMVKGQANETGDRIAELVDVKAALQGLHPNVADLLELKYKHRYTSEMLAVTVGISTDAAKKRVQRAVKAVQRSLGRMDRVDDARPARRKVRTNAAARAALSNNYEG